MKQQRVLRLYFGCCCQSREWLLNRIAVQYEILHCRKMRQCKISLEPQREGARLAVTEGLLGTKEFAIKPFS